MFCGSYLVACSPMEEKPSEGELLGTWEWIRTEDPNAEDYQDIYLTPENTFRTISQDYRKDGLVHIIENDTLIKTAHFEIGEDNVVRHIYDDTTFLYDFQVKGDFLKLILHPDMVIQETYARPGTN